MSIGNNSVSKSSIAVLAVAMMSGAASAQTPSAAPAAPSAQTTTTTTSSTPSERQAAGQFSISKQLNGLYVYNDSNENLGSINDFITDASGKIQKVVIGVGGFLGIGEHNVAVNFDQLKWVNEAVKTSSNTPPAGVTTTMPAAGATVGSAATTTTTTTARASNMPDHAVLSATKDQLKAMPQFTYAK